ncbi:MAG: hypothetical protein V1743_00055 [Nanoarchaeota archaeon]
MPVKKQIPVEKKKLILNKVGIKSYAKIAALIMAIVGFIEGLFYLVIVSIIGYIPESATGDIAGNIEVIKNMGFAIVIILPIVYAVIGFLLGACAAWVYNLLARWVGGVELEFK